MSRKALYVSSKSELDRIASACRRAGLSVYCGLDAYYLDHAHQGITVFLSSDELHAYPGKETNYASLLSESKFIESLYQHKGLPVSAEYSMWYEMPLIPSTT
jgi:hypothetical protein